MKHTTPFREYLRDLRRLNEPILASEHGVISPIRLTQHQAGAEELAALMRRDAAELVRRVAAVYEKLSPADRKAFLPNLRALQDRADQAYHVGRWVEFQAVLVEIRAVLAQAQLDTPQPPPGKHWVYRAWSRVLDAEVWFVHCEEEVAQLARQGAQRGSIYTEAELVELLRLPRPSLQALKDLHMVKAYFNATVATANGEE